MTNNEYNKLYESLMYNISITVLHEINEAYDNALLEEYNFKEFLLNTISKSKKALSKISDNIDSLDKKYLIAKKVIVNTIKAIRKSKGYNEAVMYVHALKNTLADLIVDGTPLTSKDFINAAKNVALTLGLLSAMTFGYIMNQAQEECKQETPTEIRANIQHEETLIEDIETADTPEEFNTDDIKLSNKTVNTTDINTKAILPSKIFKNDKDFTFKSSNTAREFIKKHEFCLLYPYYANKAEESQGKVTIGYGHVVTPEDGPLYNQILLLKKLHKITLSFAYDKKQGLMIINPKHCKLLINEKGASALFLKDIKVAEKRAFNALTNMNTDDNVKCYMLYNQKIIDGLTSLCYNAGNLKHDKYSFITKGLANCRYDYKNNCINKGDYNVSFSMFKNIKDNPNRRNEEYINFFCDANKPMKVNKA